MNTKIQGLEVIERDTKRGSAEYTYKGVRISKYTQETGHKTRIRGGYSRAGVKFTFKVNTYRVRATVQTGYIISKAYTLKETISDIDRWLTYENSAVENGRIISGVSDRAILRAEGKISA
jgi:hypothetical protein